MESILQSVLESTANAIGKHPTLHMIKALLEISQENARFF
jgi:hypothetical protein